MPFAVATLVTNIGKRMFTDRVRQSPGTYTSAPKWAAMGVGATGASRTAAVGDTALTTEVEARVSGTESNQTSTSNSITGDTYQNVATITASASRSVDEFMLNDTSSSGGGMFVSATLAIISLASADSIQFTTRVTVQ